MLTQSISFLYSVVVVFARYSAEPHILYLTAVPPYKFLSCVLLIFLMFING